MAAITGVETSREIHTYWVKCPSLSSEAQPGDQGTHGNVSYRQVGKKKKQTREKVILKLKARNRE